MLSDEQLVHRLRSELAPLRARVDLAERVREQARERKRTGRRWSPMLERQHRPTLGMVAVGLSSLVVVAVVVVGLALLHHSGAPGETSAPSPRGLIARLAVLRRPQTPADRLPADVKLPPRDGKVVPGLTRLVATPPPPPDSARGRGVRLFLAVTKPLTGPDSLWSPKLGDQVSVVALTRYGTTQTLAIPAADLSNAQPIGVVGGRVLAGRIVNRAAALKDDYMVGIVPDGVAYVRWTFGKRGKPVVTLKLPVSHNIAYIAYGQPLRSRAGAFLHATWYAANGAMIPTSDRALRRALQTRQNEQRAQLIRVLSHEPSHRAPPALLADFAVFAITRRTGVRISSGLTISRPRLSSLPLAVLRLLNPFHSIQPDLTQIRQIASPAGFTAWVIPGQDGICIVGTGPSLGRTGALGGHRSAGACQPNLARAEQGGAGFGGGGLIYQVLPKTKPTLRIRTGPNSGRTIRVPYGIYLGPS